MSEPESMTAMVVERLDGPSAARVTRVPQPAGAHERARGRRLVVDVHAAGLSFIDVLQSYGSYQYGAPTPYVSGSEVAGVVSASDPGTGFTVGDRVGGIVFWGGLAERALAAPEYTVRLPDSMTFADGAAVYLNYSTAWYAYHRSGLRPGQSVLVHGAAGGVGTAALDLAATFGVRAIAVVSSDQKEGVARLCGARDVVRSDGPWLDEVRRLTGGHGVDAVFDPVGGDRFTDSLRSLRIGGTLVVIGFAGGSIPVVTVNRLLLRNLTVTGISMDTMDSEHPGTLLMVRDAVQELLDQGLIHPYVGACFPLERSVDALRLIEDGAALGKVIVEIPR
ncbi:NADPH:quinone oxidoreductase family protein [Glaciibacter sp. 2TAF33]|uniref:NADPH:quinone oxidoreductase family protein n=1 Tax=Glaciibacter sp. 2TAF33 TaxID=3233015 RepID=UPI003F8F487C